MTKQPEQPLESTDTKTDRLKTIGFKELSVILNKTEKTVRRLSAETPDRLPPSLPGFRPRTWRLITVEEWLDKLEGRTTPAQPARAPRTEHPATPARRGPGRPPKMPR